MPKVIASKRPLALLCLTVLASLFFVTPWGLDLDNILYDTAEVNFGQVVNADDIVVVGIDEPSFQQLQLQWPWPRDVHARLIRELTAQGAKVIAFDLLFPEASDASADNDFAKAIKESAPVVLGTDFKKIVRPNYALTTVIPPIDLLIDSGAQIGHVSIPADRDSFVRRTEIVIEDTPSLAATATAIFLDKKCCDEYPPLSTQLIDFTGGIQKIKQVSYYQALNAKSDLPPDYFNDKLVLVGVTSISAALPDRQHTDHYATPLSRGNLGYTPGVLIHAFIANSLINESGNTALPRIPVACFGIAVALLFARFALFDSISTTLFAGTILVALLATSCIYLLTRWHVYAAITSVLAPTIAVLMASPTYNFLLERQRKQQIRRAFSSYVNTTIVEQIEKDPDNLKLGGKQITGTVLFMDMVGFSTLTEKESPETMITFINEFLSAMIDIGMKNGGTVERFLGDAIMLIWGAPVEQPDHAERACTTALEMLDKIQEISTVARSAYGFEVGARIGINSGSMTAGNIGGANRFAYTVLGDAVNLAARFENANKLYGSSIIIGQSSIDELRAKNSGLTFNTRLMDISLVKGRRQEENIYELLDEPLSAAHKLAQTHYEEGLHLLKRGKLTEAEQQIKKSAEHQTLHGLEKLIAECREP